MLQESGALSGTWWLTRLAGFMGLHVVLIAGLLMALT